MISFVLSFLLLVVGYFVYGRIVERIFAPDDRVCPAVKNADGVDFIVLPKWKVFMIQFLNIAGTGPIFGSIMGMWFGPSAYLWIVFGCIFAGAVHDYLTGMISMRQGGVSVPNIVGTYLGDSMRKVMMVFSVVLLILVGAVFVLTPATLLQEMMPAGSAMKNLLIWISIIFVYYVIATMMPVDKIIGKIYPLFAFSLLFMAVALMVMLFIYRPALPEIWDGLGDMGAARLGINNEPIFPALFITIACGALSGFHATQSPLMARCVRHEKQGRQIFFGSMITEGLVALVWATISSWFFFDEGWRTVCSPDIIEQYTQSGLKVTQYFSAPKVVMYACNGWLGLIGGILAVFGVIAAPITSGDTALRSARLIIVDYFKVSQKPIPNRLLICIPIFLVTIGLLVWQIDNPDSFNVIWKYFGWANQTLAVCCLWAYTVYLAMRKRQYLITLIPAIFMTMVCCSFFLISRISLGMDVTLGYIISAIATLLVTVLFFVWLSKNKGKEMLKD